MLHRKAWTKTFSCHLIRWISTCFNSLVFFHIIDTIIKNKRKSKFIIFSHVGKMRRSVYEQVEDASAKLLPLLCEAWSSYHFPSSRKRPFKGVLTFRDKAAEICFWWWLWSALDSYFILKDKQQSPGLDIKRQITKIKISEFCSACL